MKEIEKAKYKARKAYEYDDDIAVLFYKGNKVARHNFESYRKSWIEEAGYFDNMYSFLDDVGGAYIDLDKADEKDNWEHIFDKLKWNKVSKSYIYGNWELIILDI